MKKGIDCAQPLTASVAKSLVAAGQTFAARYLVPITYKWKRLTRAEAEAITAAGMKIISVFETTANRPAGGAKYGTEDGKAALAEAREIRQPAGSAIYFAVDYDAHPRDYDAIEAYLHAAASQLSGYKVGVYGSYAVIEEMAKRGAAKHFWQTYAWSRGKKSARANVWQHKNGVTLAGHPLDLNESYGGEGWWNTKSADKPAQEVKPKMSAEDANKIIGFLQAAWKATGDQESRAEFNRLANELRKASGQPLQ
ncbi:DUF1906 domain-containing protein [Cohnella panacarvi]|uniref:DUF1906 domain-containing protein n=1 Tax=Cohnella panacarvi TaxID=400776 RepID=UPI00047B75DA|nr:DUF1906 domain-containing protein [Cohnella panacarvi]